MPLPTKDTMVSIHSYFLTFLSLLSFFPSPSLPTTIPLTHFPTTPNPPSQHFHKLADNSLARAYHLKNPQTTSTATAAASASAPTTTKTPLFSHNYGAFTIVLSFGTPPQTLSFILDTGSNLVWFPCTSRYQCKNCSTSPKFSPFIPNKSTSSKIIGCRNPKCTWLHQVGKNKLQCQDCKYTANCAQICPPYLILYGSGAAGGLALSETLRLENLTSTDFLVGCSVFSSRTPDGIAGFGRGPASLPSQLGLSKFAHCLSSAQGGSLALDSNRDSGKKTPEVIYTPFEKNPAAKDRPAFSVYYYVGLRRITVGGKRVKIPYKYLAPGEDGNGGTIVDSGTTFTYMAAEAFELLNAAFVEEMKGFERDVVVEETTGLRPCFKVGKGNKTTVSFPEMRFHYKGGADVAVPVENYFAYVGEGKEVVCLTVVTDGVEGSLGSGGPGIILGNFQMQNFYVEYDLRNARLGFKKEICK